MIYAIITPLSLQAVKLANGTMQISWNSISGLTNNVECATGFPATWQILTNVVGNGGTLTAVDTNRVTGARCYRIHVLY